MAKTPKRSTGDLGFRLDISPLLLSQLEPLLDLIRTREASELCVNQFGEVLVERFGKAGWQQFSAPWLTAEWAWDLGQYFSNELELPFNRSRPILSVQLPGGHRLQMNIGSNMAKGIALTVRVKRKFTAKWSDFDIAADGDLAKRIIAHIEAGGSFLVSGGTYSGKTTLLNLLITFIHPDLRLLTAEDVGELDVPHYNWAPFLLSRLVSSTTLTYDDLPDSVIRHRPDVVGWGEVSRDNTMSFLRVLNTGHECAFSCVHANSPELALRALDQNLTMAGHQVSGAIEYFAEAIGMIIQVKRGRDGRRRITDVVSPRELPLVRRLMAA